MTVGTATAAFLTLLILGVLAWRTQRRAHARHRHAELEAQLLQSQKMEAIGRLAGGVAHDFNNILTAVMGFAELAHQQLEDGHPVKHDIEEIRRAAASAASLTKQLLIFSRKEVARPRVPDLNEVAAGLDKMLRRLVGEDIDFVMQQGPGPAHVRADAGQVEQVIVNLVVNARDAMPAGGRLVIKTAHVTLDEAAAGARQLTGGGDFVTIAILDTGTGMAPEVQAQIFQPFFTTKGPDTGTGLGLPTALRIVQQAGGGITVDSSPGRGATFTVYLPAVSDDIEAPSNAESAGGAARESGTILLVEDDESVRALGVRALRGCGFTVLSARHAADAIEAAERHRGDIKLLLTDMPGLNGRELADRLRSERPALRVMAPSKPYTPGSLVQAVREVLKNA